MDAGPKHTQGELSLQEKLQVAEQLGEYDCRVDLSGGEPLINKKDHFRIMEILSSKLGTARVGLSCSGKFIDEGTARKLALLTGSVEMTIDYPLHRTYPYRGSDYHETAARSAVLLKQHGIRVGIQTVVTRTHLEVGVIEELYDDLCDLGIDEWSLLRYMPAGRGASFPYLDPSEEECIQIVRKVRELHARNDEVAKPEIDISYMLPGSLKDSACRCVKRSVGILPDGRVTSCFWALLPSAQPRIANNRFLLGTVPAQRFSDILRNKKSAFWHRYKGDTCALYDSAIMQESADVLPILQLA
jgi:MoaA/NifB/PqqE/SkfB family radical SAM enzyme